MLEIAIIIWLVSSNAKIARANNRSPGLYGFLTVLLWVGMEITGAVIGALVVGEGFAPYIFALIFAAIGGVISRVIVSR
jgi:hypothetical protein